MYLGIKLFLSDHKPEHWLFFKGNEFWKDVFEYEGLYQVSTKGNLKSFRKNKTGILLRKFKTKKGYYLVYLSKSPKIKYSTSIHRLVAKAFIPNPENKPEVNHKKLKSNNSLSNLEWATGKENIQHAIKNGFRTANINLKNNTMFTNEDIFKIRNLFSEGLKNTDIAILFKCDHSTISKIRTGIHYNHVI